MKNNHDKWLLSKKGASLNATITLISILFIVVIVGGIIYLKQPTQPLTTITTETSTPATVKTSSVQCSSDGNTNFKQRYEDTAASTKTYVASLITYAQFLRGNANAQKVMTLANTSSTDFSSATTSICDAINPTFYRPIAVEHQKGDATVYGYESSLGYVLDKNTREVSVAGSTVFIEFLGKRTDLLKATVKDKNNQDKYLNATGDKAGGAGTTGYAVLNQTFTDQGGQSSLTIATDGYFDLEISVKTNNTRNVFGNTDPITSKPLVFNEKPLRTILAIDADTSDWQEPVLSGGNIVKIDKSSLSPDDQTVFSSYEYFYTVDSLKDTDTIFRWYMQSKSGINPSMSPKLRFCSEGVYLSLRNADTFKVGCFDDSSTNKELTVSNTLDRHELKIGII